MIPLFYGAYFSMGNLPEKPVDAGDRGHLDAVDVELLEEAEGRSVGPLGLPLFCPAAQPWRTAGCRENVRNQRASTSK